MPITDQQLPLIRGLLPMTLIDWPGRIAAVLFVPGCNLRCGYCHSPDLLEARSAEQIPFEQVRQYLQGKRNWLDGVVICGGEPTLHPQLGNLCRAIREMGFGVKLDTNGTRPQAVADLLAAGLLDGVSMDVKTALDGRMAALARAEVDLEAIEATIDLLLAASAEGLEVEFRTTCCPAYVDEEVVRWVAARVAGGEGARNPPVYQLQRFNPEHCLEAALRDLKPYNAGQMEALLAAARSINPRSRLRGQQTAAVST